jgi:hypothetical protein
MLYEIAQAVAQPDHIVTVTWSDGAIGHINFAPYIAKGGLFSALSDPNYFVKKMRILPNGIGLSWPNDVDFSADGLRYDAFPKEESGEYEEAISPKRKTKSNEETCDRPR